MDYFTDPNDQINNYAILRWWFTEQDTSETRSTWRKTWKKSTVIFTAFVAVLVSTTTIVKPVCLRYYGTK